MAGTSVKIDRDIVASSLGFKGIVLNSIDAVSSRDIAVEALSTATITMLDASRLAEELILWSTTEFDFIELGDAYAASSSIMPQKKNAVTAETVRAKAGSVLGDLTAVCAITKALPYSYNLDLQEASPLLWRGLDDAIRSLKVLAGTLSSASLKLGPIKKAVAGDSSTAVALANFLVKEHHVSFRNAHAIVGELVRISAESGKSLPEVIGSMIARVSSKYGRKITIDSSTAKDILDPNNFLASIVTEGGSNPRFLARELKNRQRMLAGNTSAASRLSSTLRDSRRRLHARASRLAREVKSRD